MRLNLLDWTEQLDEETLFYKLIGYMDKKYEEIKDELSTLYNPHFDSEIHKSAIKSVICRRYSSFRFCFSVFESFLSISSDSSAFIDAISSNTLCI